MHCQSLRRLYREATRLCPRTLPKPSHLIDRALRLRWASAAEEHHLEAMVSPVEFGKLEEAILDGDLVLVGAAPLRNDTQPMHADTDSGSSLSPEPWGGTLIANDWTTRQHPPHKWTSRHVHWSPLLDITRKTVEASPYAEASPTQWPAL